jgi:CheY-like chemotaxis protein
MSNWEGPRIHALSFRADPRGVPNSVPETTGAPAACACLLIVDDNPEMRRVIRRMVSGFAREIVECESGAEALAAYTERRPDCVLMDIEMRGVDGITATRQIIAAFPGARIIIVTGHSDAPLRDAARDAGAFAYVLKENLLDLRRLLTSPP